MQPQPASLTPEAAALLQQLRDLVSGDRPDFVAARRLAATIPPTDAALRDRADRLLRVAEAMKSAAPSSPERSPTGLAGRLVGLFSERWKPLAVVVAGGVVALLAYLNWPTSGIPPAENPHAPLAAREPFPLPVPLFVPDGMGRGVTFQHGRLLALHVLPAPAGFRLDDDFEAWDRRALFHSAWAAPYADQYFVDGGLWVDDQYLYWGARVADPWPLRSRSRPGATTDGGWEGGSLQLRLALAGWPVEEAHPTEKFYHLTIWHYAPEGKAYLHVGRGKRLELKAGPPLPSGGDSEKSFAARFSPWGKRGYVMKCRIPWSLLGQEKAPAVPSLGLCWDVCWSDPTGERFVGKLTEFFDPERFAKLAGVVPESDLLPGKQSYQVPAIWGRAILPPGPAVSSR